MRKLATIETVHDIRPIEGADKIEVALIKGWETVVKKGEFSVGSAVVYIEIDSIVPERPEFEFLRERKFRVRTIKLRGQVSQGLVMPLSVLPVAVRARVMIGDDVTKELGITKYDPEAEAESKRASAISNHRNPVVKFMMRFAWFRKLYLRRGAKTGKFPSWISKTDEPRAQNCFCGHAIKRARKQKHEFIVTEKLDGCSLTLFLERKRFGRFEFGVCSRNFRLTVPDDSCWWKVARQINAENVLKELLGCGNRIALQGEIIGEKVQGNRYGVKGLDFYAFNLIIDGAVFTGTEIEGICSEYGIKSVPILDASFELPDSAAEMVGYAEGRSVLANVEREGVVVRNVKQGISFKAISQRFLLGELAGINKDYAIAQ